MEDLTSHMSTLTLEENELMTQKSLRNYEIYHKMDAVTATVEIVRNSSAGIEGYANDEIMSNMYEMQKKSSSYSINESMELD